MTAPRISFRPLRRDDFVLLSGWLAAPHVKMWWRESSDIDAIERRYGPVVDGIDPTEVFVIDGDGQPIGLIQRYRFADDPEWRDTISVAGTPSDAAGIDYLIGVEHLTGIGLGPEVIGAFLTDTWSRYLDIDTVVVDIQENNRRSWRALEKIGFRRSWTGTLTSDDPSDKGVNHVYVLLRPVASGSSESA
jgi:aminoglycoside 6'-N-acetyltransferase